MKVFRFVCAGHPGSKLRMVSGVFSKSPNITHQAFKPTAKNRQAYPFSGFVLVDYRGNKKPCDTVIAMLLRFDFCASKQTAADGEGNHTSSGWGADVWRKQSTKQAIFCPAAERQMHLLPPPSLHGPHCHHMELRHWNVHMQNRKQSRAGLQSEETKAPPP